jgi:predicted DNA binding CopG/RHH family protein
MEKSKVVTMSLKESEYKKIVSQANKKGMSFSAFIRFRLLYEGQQNMFKS